MGSMLDDPLFETRTAVNVVLASPMEEDHSSLRKICARQRWFLYEATTCRETIALAKRCLAPVVICERDLVDGDWKMVLASLAQLQFPPRLIVSSRMADHHLWADVLSLGGYDLLLTPFDASEVSRVIYLAWQSSRPERHSATAVSVSAA